MAAKNEIKNALMQWTDSNKEIFYKASETIWNHPEIALEENKSAEVLCSLLRKHGFAVEKGIADMPTAFIASYGSGKPVIGINAEYDALPGLSQKRNSLKKDAERLGHPGHGCGHNLLGTGSVKAAIAVKFAIEKFSIKGTVKVIGAPAEEVCIGKVKLGKEGYLQEFDAFLDWHPWSYNWVGYESCPAYFSVKYHFKGKAAHGNSPWHGRSAMDAALLQAHSVELLREHIHPGMPPEAANTINYTFSDTGPSFPSVVPDKATAWYIGRFVTTEEAKNALHRVTKCAEGAALATETAVETELITATHHKIPNKTLAKVMYGSFKEIGVPEFTEEEQTKAKLIQRELGTVETGLEVELRPFGNGYTVVCDTSEYSWNAPYATAWVAMGMKDCGWHHWGVTRCAIDTMGRKSMDKAANVIGLSAIELLMEPELIKKAQDEWRELLQGKQYETLI